MKRKLPFYSNTRDNTHCYQACLKMVLKDIFPNKTFSFKQLDSFTHKSPKKWTWHPAVLSFLSKLKLKPMLYSDGFDYAKLLKYGEGYIRKKKTATEADAILKHTNLELLLKDTKKIIGKKSYTIKKLELNHIIKLFDKYKYVILLVNSQKLNKKKGHAGHFVLMVGYDKNNIYVHDPGRPPQPNRKVSNALFKKAYFGDVLYIK